MSKAEEKALEKYPAERGHMHDRPYQREGFIEGYHQAEKDLGLTWEDIRKIVLFYDNVLNDKDFNTLPIKDGYTEVLKRFKDFKERK